MRLHIYCLGIFMFMLPFSLLAQPHWEGGFAFGAAGYQGELAPRWYPEISEKGAAYGLFFRRHLSRQLALRLDLGYAEISGNDRNFNQEGFDIRNFRFKSQLGRAGLLLEWEPLGHRRYPNPYQFKALAFSPYIFTGAGLLYTDANADFSQSRTDKLTHLILIDQAIPMPDTRFYVPFGVGFKLDLSQRSVIGLEAGTLTAFTDYLDGISQSGNPGAKDWMSFAQLTFTLRIVAKDSDRDGIADKEDNCPLVAGNWTALGCPDGDGDGVEDLEDICPAAAGPRQLNGCPDTDGDGVADWEDRCPNLRGTLATMGCPDFDHDGLADQDDKCPRLPGPKGKLGCPALDTDADGDLSDEPEMCILSPTEACLQLSEEETLQLASLLKALRPPASIQPLVEEAPPKEKTESAGLF